MLITFLIKIFLIKNNGYFYIVKKLFVFMLFASCMLITSVGMLSYGTQTGTDIISELTVDKLNVEKAVITDYAMLTYSAVTCVTTEIDVLLEYMGTVNEVGIAFYEGKFRCHKLARDNII